ncbi:MAG: Na+/H+ antiporter NhaA [Planctomycetes bacterium]|nr:Na+/H+ antiporter NhaA [Planctomycetota bacterium]MCP4771165.1 Na+/H+ antiporter NhaA [Planctomycetota bacterium]MCP4862108.1 Na+/H+ antiporter NhaA [Planctomycetota bacterium]
MTNSPEPTRFLNRFLKQESASGILLIFATVLAMIFANTPLRALYDMLIETPVAIQVGALEIAKPLLLWVNDGLMAMFFLLVGLELKREYLEGELNQVHNVVLPALGAVGGMVVPALIYVWANQGDDLAMQGWAIPAATDIAFALGILSLLGPRVPASLKIFLTSLAIFDDLGAILIIAFFFTSKVSMTALIIAGSCVVVLAIMNRRGVVEKSPYLLIGAIMWVALLKSGVHATLAGVVLAMFMPMRDPKNPAVSPLKSLERDLHSAVAYFILPIFAFCNAGIHFSGVGSEQLLHGVTVGITLGLLFGKQLGIMFFCWLGIKLKVAKLPDHSGWGALYGTAVLCGIGFTMSLFVGSLAFEESGGNLGVDERIGIVAGSLASGVLGYLVLKKVLPARSVGDGDKIEG